MKTALIICIFALGFGALYTSSATEPTKQVILEDTVKIDPVCKMKVKQPAKYISIYKKEEYWFCSKGCKLKFDKNPEKYIKK